MKDMYRSCVSGPVGNTAISKISINALLFHQPHFAGYKNVCKLSRQPGPFLRQHITKSRFSRSLAFEIFVAHSPSPSATKVWTLSCPTQTRFLWKPKLLPTKLLLSYRHLQRFVVKTESGRNHAKSSEVPPETSEAMKDRHPFWIRREGGRRE